MSIRKRTRWEDFVCGRTRARKFAGLAAAFLTIIGLSASAGFLVAQSSGLQLDVTLYAAEDSQAQLFTSDEFGNIFPEEVQTLPTRVGLNNLSFSLEGSRSLLPLVQRFDPCECVTPTLFEGISVSAPFFNHSVVWEELLASGASLTAEGSSYVVVPEQGNGDPQLLMYLNLQELDSASWWSTFWGVALTSFGVAWLVLGGIALVMRYFWFMSLGPSSPGRLSRRVGEPEVPFALAILATLGMTVGMVQQVAGALTIGATVDEPAHVRHLANFFESGNYSSAAYGPASSLIGHGLNVLLGVETWGVPLETAEAYAFRHLSVAMIGILGTFAVSATAWIIFRSWRWAAVAGALLSALPLWVGHSMFNMKDIPVATGYSLVTLGLVVFFSRKMGFWGRGAIALGSLALGFVIGVGTRPGITPLFAASVGLALIMAWGMVLLKKPRLQAFASVTVSAVLVMAALVYAARLTDTGRSLLAGVERSADFPWSGTNLYAGELVGGRPGVGMILAVFVGYAPLGFALLVGLGIATTLVLAIRSKYSSGWSRGQRPALLLVASQAGLAFVGLWLLDPVIYDGGRQILFVFPAFALFATVGVAGLLQFLLGALGSKIGARGVVATGFVLILVTSHTDQLRLFPYNYSYYNLVAQGEGINGQWETDYWGSSMREGAASFVSGDPALCGGSGDLNRNIGPDTQPCDILAPYVGTTGGASTSRLESRQFWVVRTERALTRFGPIASGNCSLDSEVTRQLRSETVVMARVYRCDDL